MDVSTEHYAVGPISLAGDHSVVFISSEHYPDVADGATEGTLFVCLDCGLVSTEKGWFHGTEKCDRENNAVPKTLREEIGDFEV